MGTVESRLAALETLHAQQGADLPTRLLEMAVLQDMFIKWKRIVTGEDASALEGLVEKMPPPNPRPQPPGNCWSCLFGL